MPMNEEVRKAVPQNVAYAVKAVARSLRDVFIEEDIVHYQMARIRAELTRLTEIADSVDPLVVRLGEVTTKLEAANALLREADPYVFGNNRDLSARIAAHFTATFRSHAHD